MLAIRDNLVQCFSALRTHKHGISYGNGWTHVDGWSERIVDFIAAVEAQAAA